jgi:hypothetical protein
LTEAKQPTDAPPKPWTFIALDRLLEFRRVIDPRIELILVFMPFHISALPQAGSPAQEWIEACKARAAAIAEAEPRTILIDRMRNDEIAHNANNFWDAKHVRDSIIRELETGIAAVMRPAHVDTVQ